jgi:hypothetical protein
VHRGSEIAGIHAHHRNPDGPELARQRSARQVQRGFARAVDAPSRVGTDRSVARNVDHEAPGPFQAGEQLLHEPERSHDIHPVDSLHLIERRPCQRRQWGRPELARVVEQDVEPALGRDQPGEGAAMGRLGNVARESADRDLPRAQLLSEEVEPLVSSRGQDQIEALGGKEPRERCPESLARSRDER